MINDIIEDWFTKRGFMATLIMEGERAGQHVLEVRTSRIYTICKQYSLLDKYQSVKIFKSDILSPYVAFMATYWITDGKVELKTKGAGDLYRFCGEDTLMRIKIDYWETQKREVFAEIKSKIEEDIRHLKKQESS